MRRQQLFIKLTSLEEAWRLIEKRIPPKPLGVEEVLIEDSLNRVLAEDVYSPISYPPYPRSIVDGYAVRVDDVRNVWEDRPVELVLKGELRIGEPPGKISVGPGETVYVDTGSPIPDGADGVVPVEYTARNNGRVIIYRSVALGENIAWPGSDVVRGELLFKKGERITAYHIAVLANIGVRRVKVYSKPRIAIISTGDELVEPGVKLEPGKVYDSNSFSLKAMLERDGFRAERLGIVGDDENELEKILSKALREYDVVLLSGGTSAGVGDIVYRVLGKIGKLIVHGLKLKPGKPTIIARVNNKPVFGLPGNPGSARNVYEVLVKPYLYRIEGSCYDKVEELEAILALPVQGARGRRTYQPVILYWNNIRKEWIAIPYEYESYMIKRVLEADGILVIGEEEYAPIKPGSKRKIIPLRIDKKDVIVGEESQLLTRIADKENKRPLPLGSLTAKIMFENSYVSDIVVSDKIIGEDKLSSTIKARTIVNRKILVVARSDLRNPVRVAWYSQNTSLSLLQDKTLKEFGNYRIVKIKAKTPLQAALLFNDNQVDVIVIPEEHYTILKKPNHIVFEDCEKLLHIAK